MTATRSATWRTIDMSWLMNRYVRSSRSCRSSSRFRICDCIETSSALTGSSATRKIGSTASARAIRGAAAGRRRTRAGSGRAASRRQLHQLEQLAEALRARLRGRGRGGPCPRRRSSATFSRGFSEPYGSWKTIWACAGTSRISAGEACSTSMPVEADRTRPSPRSAAGQPRQGALAAAALADQGQRLAGADLEVDLAHGLERARRAPEEVAGRRGSASSAPARAGAAQRARGVGL